ncbi:MAG: hypothetical protein F9K16_00275 [Thermoanaerobaculia bacterium]|nr:MAG: hypothetical protein F9K16_00275 [Thermoanaerobaculia bacterium]MBZ0103698.1 hypothetical protein [Thermoanaerobaculia bacterium]
MRTVLLLVICFVAQIASTPRILAQWWGGCRDALGTPVLEYANPSLPDIAMATIVNGGPAIIYNPNVTLSVGSRTRRFFYFHECGHHALGQIVSRASIPFQAEQEADCWAAQTLVESGGFTAADLELVARDVSTSPGDWSHLPGPQRALNLLRCIGDDFESSETCRTVTVYEERTDWRIEPVVEQMPCQHPICYLYSGCWPAHAFDLITVQRQVPVTITVPVSRTVCD